MRIGKRMRQHRYLMLCTIWTPLAWMLALPPVGLWPLGSVLYVPLLYVCCREPGTVRRSILAGVAAGLIAALTVFGTFLFNPAEQLYARLLLAGLFLGFFVIHFLLVYLAARQRTPVVRMLVFVVGILATEYLVSRTRFALPLFTGLLIIDTPLAVFFSQTAGYLAPSAAVLLCNAGIAALLLESPKRAVVTATIICAAAVAPLYPGHHYEYSGFRLGYVQQAVPHPIIRAAAHFPPLYWDIAGQYIDAIEQFDSRLDAVILPENAFLLQYDHHHDVYERIESLAQRMRSDIVAPAILEGGNEERYTALLHFSADGRLQDEYRKINLVPAVESAVFTAGASSTLFHGNIRIGPMLCYDSVFPQLYAEYRDAKADLVVVAADAGFIRTTAVPWIHLSYARLYSTAYDVPVLHVSQSGPSALITPDGKMTGITQADQAGIVVVEL
ncbi:MAG: nitrilase-related carbon-nitrogen hydrolase [Spirochaetota bacterium]